jgi:hypothetical protein
VKHLASLVPLVLAFGAAYGAELPPSKAGCDAVLAAEVKRLEDGFSRTRDAWEKSVEQRFSDHDRELTSMQMQAARTTFNQLVLKLSNEHVKAVALPGIYRMMLTIPQYDVGVCSKPVEMRALGDQAITGFLLQLTQLLPLVETSVDAAKSGG